MNKNANGVPHHSPDTDLNKNANAVPHHSPESRRLPRTLGNLIPSVIAFAVDFTTGAIYLPPSGYGNACPPASDEPLVSLEVPRKELSQQRVEEVASRHAGRDVRLVAGQYQTAPLAKLADFWPTRARLAAGCG